MAAALLFPVLIFIGTATRLSAARREQRFAAMRLVGRHAPADLGDLGRRVDASPRSSAPRPASGCSSLLRAPLATVPFTGDPFFPSDLSLSLADVLLVAVGVPVGGGGRGPARAAPGAASPRSASAGGSRRARPGA